MTFSSDVDSTVGPERLRTSFSNNYIKLPSQNLKKMSGSSQMNSSGSVLSSTGHATGTDNDPSKGFNDQIA